MREVVSDSYRKIVIGYAGENLAVDVEFDVSGWSALYGDGDFYLLNRRPGETQAYPVMITQSEHKVNWHVTATDTEYEGIGECELMYIVDEVVAKSVVYNTIISHALGYEENPPGPWIPWVETIIQTKDESLQYSYDSEAWATGMRDNVPVTEEDETYENNAKYYADLAEQGASTAGYLEIEINEDGDLIYTRTNISDIDFVINNDGELILIRS